MTSTTEPRIFHARSSGVTLPGVPSAVGGTATGRVLRQWEEFEVTDELRAETVDRNGNSWLDLDAQAQVARWGSQKIAEGPAPEGVTVGADDDAVQFKAAFAKLEYARKISDPAERKLAVQKVWRDYGDVLRDLHQDYR